ncbi:MULTISPECIES: GntR family transcriptional regulator [unclassified Rhodococcus (in: high G+C Gram-positive bacteria)]|uniref:GntR family transcriptional regulator n=1 Tax=unclassified Rhodococcus (in: high G+C Gram-positive bacteria) TaxID=192944 RepID=UPI001639AA8A|nr:MULTISPECIES: GntR family transcriptional regulator [unclassified Rhodococcus (in: high G+C Gram-positive bacteria)]MBC2640355.1 GntR family transcriptional regulator [Rhodococcus sp. 3A]MBC2894899.1 GntR family transcriptional regulator [Rhodococcus sp. 4CII]
MNGRERERETEPAYQLVSRQLREHIAAGKYRGGIKLPTEFELAEQHGVSRQTVRRAFQDLVAEGIVYRVPGRGTFAAESDGRYLRQLGSIEDLMNLSTDTTMEVVSPLRRRVDIEAASRLRLDTDLVHTVAFRRRHDDTPFVLTTVYLPDEIARLVADAPEMSAGAVSSYTIIGLLEPHLRSPIVEAAQSITVAAAPADVARELGCAEGHSMLRVDRLYSDAEGRTVELAVSYFLPEHYTYRVTLRRGGR